MSTADVPSARLLNELREVQVTLAYFEYWLSVGKFEYVNDLLRHFLVADAQPATLCAILTITHPATKDQLRTVTSS